MLVAMLGIILGTILGISLCIVLTACDGAKLGIRLFSILG
jgi:hypothetical protein